jgi:predicted thioesterase
MDISGAVGVGVEIHATARCLGLEENILKFEVEVHQVARLIATGLITRKFVERVSFMARVAAETMMAEKGASVSEKKVASSLNF